MHSAEMQREKKNQQQTEDRKRGEQDKLMWPTLIYFVGQISTTTITRTTACTKANTEAEHAVTDTPQNRFALNRDRTTRTNQINLYEIKGQNYIHITKTWKNIRKKMYISRT
jgi:hypothetical protein